jgi:hypothetical protein
VAGTRAYASGLHGRGSKRILPGCRPRLWLEMRERCMIYFLLDEVKRFTTPQQISRMARPHGASAAQPSAFGPATPLTGFHRAAYGLAPFLRFRADSLNPRAMLVRCGANPPRGVP